MNKCFNYSVLLQFCLCCEGLFKLREVGYILVRLPPDYSANTQGQFRITY